MTPHHEVHAYGPERQGEWDALVRSSRNGVFIFERSFMDYHSDRFEDASCVVMAQDRVAAIFPANRVGDTVHSHGGLTFGGLVYSDRTRATEVIAMVDAVVRHYASHGFRKLLYKPVPSPFTSRLADEAPYALHKAGGRLIGRNLGSMIDLEAPAGISKGRLHGLRAGARAGVSYVASDDYGSYFPILAEALSRHGVAPAHSLEEILLLKARFPDNIALRLGIREGSVLAGCVVFKYRGAWHTQYMANSRHGRELGALDLVIFELVAEARRSRAGFLSFGISTGGWGRTLNEGLIKQKEGFGARGLVHDLYEIGLE